MVVDETLVVELCWIHSCPVVSDINFCRIVSSFTSIAHSLRLCTSGHMRLVFCVASTLEACVLKVVVAIIDEQLLFGANIPQRLEKDNVPFADEVAPCFDVRRAMGIDEACPVASFLGVNNTGTGYLESVERILGLL